MKNAEALGYRGRYEKLAPVLTETFDFPAMAKVVMGGHWTSIGTAHKEAFTTAFTEYSIGVFANRFDGYGGETFEVVGEQPAGRGPGLVENRLVMSTREAVALTLRRRPERDGQGGSGDTT